MGNIDSSFNGPGDAIHPEESVSLVVLEQLRTAKGQLMRATTVEVLQHTDRTLNAEMANYVFAVGQRVFGDDPMLWWVVDCMDLEQRDEHKAIQKKLKFIGGYSDEAKLIARLYGECCDCRVHRARELAREPVEESYRQKSPRKV